ncbi:macrophage migration inhibitory factor-like [Lytechinus pictus]|uniref:macrophage migration inhibitory factor-like n=1 Tax=Lytechinus pictus TaxID=7653 RepID=UPI0030BA2A7F
MPLVVISTNIKRSSIPEGFLKGFSKVYSEAVNREERMINCSLYAGVEMIRNGTDEPACVITIRHTIPQDTDGRRETTRRLLEYAQTQLKLTDENMKRFSVVFLTPKRDEIGTCSGMLCDRD